MFELRQYQKDAIEATYDHLRERDDNPCIVIPTGGGKTPIMATICQDTVERWHGRVLILAHVKELLQQAIEKIRMIAPGLFLQTGIYSAGLKSRETDKPVIIAGIQSVFRRACELGAFDIILIDECHRIPADGEGMYLKFIEDARKVNPNVRIIGLTATPFRMKSGMICESGNILNEISYEIGVKELIDQGFLCPLVTKSTKDEIDTSGLHIRAGEFIPEEAEALMNQDSVVENAVTEILSYVKDRRSVLIFAVSVKHGKHVAKVIEEQTDHKVGTVFGETLDFERQSTIDDFKEGKVKFLVNMNVLTLGFDAPNIDCVVMLRPTASPGLYYQMCGRGFRPYPNLENCLILDYGNNVMRHGPVDAIRIEERKKRKPGEAIMKVCPTCKEIILSGYMICPECGHQFEQAEKDLHDGSASERAILSGTVTIEELTVMGMPFFSVHTKKGADDKHPKTLRVDYQVSMYQRKSEWICFEHTGMARRKAVSWWKQRSDEPVPLYARDAVKLCGSGCIAETLSIKVRSVAGEKYDRIAGYSLGNKPPISEPGSFDEDEEIKRNLYPAGFTDDDIPF